MSGVACAGVSRPVCASSPTVVMKLRSTPHACAGRPRSTARMAASTIDERARPALPVAWTSKASCFSCSSGLGSGDDDDDAVLLAHAGLEDRPGWPEAAAPATTEAGRTVAVRTTGPAVVPAAAATTAEEEAGVAIAARGAPPEDATAYASRPGCRPRRHRRGRRRLTIHRPRRRHDGHTGSGPWTAPPPPPATSTRSASSVPPMRTSEAPPPAAPSQTELPPSPPPLKPPTGGAVLAGVHVPPAPPTTMVIVSPGVTNNVAVARPPAPPGPMLKLRSPPLAP